MSTLILSPHMDDEVLGCSSWLASPNTTVLYMVDTHPLYPEVKVENALLKMQIGFAAKWECLAQCNHYDQLDQWAMIDAYERILQDIQPHTVLVPAPSYNQDHRACYEAMLTACRPHDRNWMPRRVMAYEEPETLGALRGNHVFRPTYFRSLELAHKLRWYGIYKSQVRGHRNEETIAALAAVRGAQAGVQHAEAFEVLRWVN